MLQHGANSFHSAKSDAPDFVKFAGKCLFFPIAARDRAHAKRKKAPHRGAFVVVGLDGAYRRTPVP